MILYGTWVLYCFYQFRNGDSWGAHVLAGLTLAVFTGVLGFFAVRIFILARRQKAADAEHEHQMAMHASGEKPYEKLFDHKPYMRRYGLFYDQFKTNFWWVFVPLIVYAFAKGAFIALGDGHGIVQTAGQLGCEVFLLILLLWNRPYNTKAGNVLNIIIAVVRVLSVGCLIVFVEELGIAADTKTVTGMFIYIHLNSVKWLICLTRCCFDRHSIRSHCCPRYLYRRECDYRYVQGEPSHQEAQRDGKTT